MDKRPNLLITGASGFTGEHACKHFSGLGFEIIAVTRKGSVIDSKGISIEYCELTNKESVYQLIKKIKPDFLLHLAAINHVGRSWEDPVKTIETNFLSTLYIIDATRQLNPTCKIVIVGSALQINPNELSNQLHPYSLSKTLQVIISQAWVKMYKMNIVIAKPSNIIGPGISNGVNSIFANKIAQMEKNMLGKVLVVNNLNSKRDFIDVRDVVSSYEVLFNKGLAGEVYEISSGKCYSIGDLIQIYKTLTDIDFKVESLSNDVDKLTVDEIPLKLLQLGWSPTFSLHSSLKDTLQYFRAFSEK
ncbi:MULTISPECIES: NAD-dependent epimerase/dehydratase family protein [unclassified Bacillus (in: firmicutes)]|uniref:NAD-dependent epimerase/dehydratase family protein n=1 Tax=unclassified Bacillus (in: firmicutes) TaxID=185979 RepID=UPI0008E40A3A|nr:MULTISPECIES: NAD-dependent epimerase/dehydratase family protein [unclassified Bacillus (in: firmicutes)]SFA72230.1 Nucleoside-diphosphate-sugar epimerase [Bacillus sp. UNCCL13]SFQ62454.1 Nucleoside-diphosphate-sugar epimerase [Bacillus sp. cl95]